MTKHGKAVAALLGSPIAGGLLAYVLYLVAGGPCRLGSTQVRYGQCVMGMSLGDAATRLGAVGFLAGLALAIAFERDGGGN